MTDLSAVESIFFAALAKPFAEERAAFLNAACGIDADLRKHVERMLAAHPKAGGFLNGLAPEMVATVEEVPIQEGPGTVIGPYRLMEQIGEGGMGLVFVAEQQHPVRRKVALKIIRPGMDSHDVIARFEAEQQALALMDHPNIARVFDAGTTASGRPYFVMELVKGIAILEYCDQQQLTARERLELFLSVCQAVQHAHGKGIIHRDLKPSNILVAPHDGVPVVKVIDFGVAKALGQRLTEKTIYTRFTQMIGTPLYMSPEQAEINALDVDIRCDIYSLGVLLYELLTGTTPFDRRRFATAAYDEIRRIIREEEPPRPSTRLSTLGEALPAVSARRKTEPAKLSALVRGDLDWIVMKALEKERSRRYETASAFAADVRRFLNQEPIEARPPSAWYRFGKLARRNKVALTTAALMAATLLLGTAASTWQALRATAAESVARRSEGVAQDQKRRAEEARAKAEQRRDELAALNEKLRRANYIADMNLAQHAWEENNLVRVRELLDRHRPRPGEADLRRFEWHYLRHQFHRDLLTVKAHGGDAMMVAYTPDGQKLVSYGMSQPPRAGESFGSRPGELKRWDAATGEAHPLPLKGPADKATCAALSPDGKRLAAGCRDKIVRVWDVDTGEFITLEGHTRESLFHVEFSHDGKRLLSLAIGSPTAPSGEIKVWDLTSRKAIVSLEKLPHTLSSAISPDGKLVAASPLDSAVVRLWDATTGRELPSLKDAGVRAYAVAFSPDGERLAAGGMDDVKIWDVATGKILVTCQGASDECFGSTFSPDGKRLATATWRGVVELWDAATGRKVRTFKGHAGCVWSVAFSPDGTHLASAGLNDGALKVWDTRGEPDAIAIPVPHRVLAPVLLSPDGRTVLTGFEGKAFQLWDAATGKPRWVTIECPHPITHFGVTPDCTRLAVAGTGNRVTICDLETGKAVRTIRGRAEPITDLAISPDGKLLAVLGKGRAIGLWDVDKGVELCTIQSLKHDLSGLSFSPDGARLVGFNFSGAVMVFDVSTGRELLATRLRDFFFILSVRLSPDGKRLAVAGNAVRFRTGEVRVFAVDSGREVVPPLKGHTAVVRAVAFSPDGQRLATGGTDRTVKVWDLTTGQEVLTLKGHTDMITSLHFVSDGRRLMSADMNGSVRVWDATPLPE